MLFIQRFFVVLLVTPVLLSLQSCQPDFVQSQSAHYARQFGVFNDFTISRWNNRVIESKSSIAVVSDNIQKVDAVALSKVVASNLAPFFQRVVGGYAKDSLASARALAKMQGTSYLFYIELTDTGIPATGDEVPADFSGLQLIMTLVDVVGGQTVDKIVLTAESSWVRLLGDDMQGLLAQPVSQIAKDLTGA